MNLLHVVHEFPPATVGGTGRHVQELAAWQNAHGHRAVVFTRVAEGAGADQSLLPATTRGDGTTVHGFLQRGSSHTDFLGRITCVPADRAFAQVLTSVRADVVHIHHLSWLSTGIVGAARAGGARVLLSIHDHALACPRGQRLRPDGGACLDLDRVRCESCVRPAWIDAVRAPDRLRALGRALLPGAHRRLFAERDRRVRAALRQVDAFIAPSESAAALFGQYFSSDRPTHVVPHGTPAAGAAAPPIPRAGQPLRLGFFGHVVPSKGVAAVACALAALPEGVAALTVHGPCHPRAAAALARAARGRLTLAGPYGAVGDAAGAAAGLAALYAATDAVVVPSLWPETYALVVREAWAHRRPVIASDIGALAALREQALLVPPGDVTAWAGAISRLATDHALFARLTGPFSDGSREHALARVTALAAGVVALPSPDPAG